MLDTADNLAHCSKKMLRQKVTKERGPTRVSRSSQALSPWVHITFICDALNNMPSGTLHRLHLQKYPD
jgi:hypothetical protein